MLKCFLIVLIPYDVLFVVFMMFLIPKLYLSFVPSLNSDSASQMEMMKQRIPQSNPFQQVTMLQY